MSQQANAVVRYAGQAVLYALFGAFVVWFSSAPTYRHLDPDEGLLRLSFRHPGQVATDCRKRSAEELAKLPPQLRAEMDCQRERSPVQVRVELDGETLFDRVYEPAGLRRDGASAGYFRMPIPVGAHDIRVQFNDDVRVKGFNYEGERHVEVTPGQVVLIDFALNRGGVVIR